MADTPTDGEVPPMDGDNAPPDWILSLLKWVAKDPWEFVTTVLMILSPFFFISAFLAYKLSKQIEAKEKEKKKVLKREKQIKRRAKID